MDQAPPDPILGVSVAFRESTDPNKLNLGVGAYRTEELKPYVLDVVKRAEKLMLEADYDKEYLPMQGLAEFNTATVQLLLGSDAAAVKEDRVATVQSLSGTGSLRVGRVPRRDVKVTATGKGGEVSRSRRSRIPCSRTLARCECTAPRVSHSARRRRSFVRLVYVRVRPLAYLSGGSRFPSDPA